MLLLLVNESTLFRFELATANEHKYIVTAKKYTKAYTSWHKKGCMEWFSSFYWTPSFAFLYLFKTCNTKAGTNFCLNKNLNESALKPISNSGGYTISNNWVFIILIFNFGTPFFLNFAYQSFFNNDCNICFNMFCFVIIFFSVNEWNSIKSQRVKIYTKFQPKHIW